MNFFVGPKFMLAVLLLQSLLLSTEAIKRKSHNFRTGHGRKRLQKDASLMKQLDETDHKKDKETSTPQSPASGGGQTDPKDAGVIVITVEDGDKKDIVDDQLDNSGDDSVGSYESMEIDAVSESSDHMAENKGMLMEGMIPMMESVDEMEMAYDESEFDGTGLPADGDDQEMNGSELFMGEGSGFMGEGSGFMGKGSGFMGEGSGFMGEGSGFMGEGSGFMGEDVPGSDAESKSTDSEEDYDDYEDYYYTEPDLTPVTTNLTGPVADLLQLHFKDTLLKLADFCETESGKRKALSILRRNADDTYKCVLNALTLAIPVNKRQRLNYAAIMKGVCRLPSNKMLTDCYYTAVKGGYELCLPKAGRLLNLLTVFIRDLAIDAVCSNGTALLNGLSEQGVNHCLSDHYEGFTQCMTTFGNKVINLKRKITKSFEVFSGDMCQNMVQMMRCLVGTVYFKCHYGPMTKAMLHYVGYIMLNIPCYGSLQIKPFTTADALAAITEAHGVPLPDDGMTPKLVLTLPKEDDPKEEAARGRKSDAGTTAVPSVSGGVPASSGRNLNFISYDRTLSYGIVPDADYVANEEPNVPDFGSAGYLSYSSEPGSPKPRSEMKSDYPSTTTSTPSGMHEIQDEDESYVTIES